MNVTVKLFAAARELAGQKEISVELPAGATIKQLRDQLSNQFVELQPLLPHALFAIDAMYCRDDDAVPEHGDIACLPPVSGG